DDREARAAHVLGRLRGIFPGSRRPSLGSRLQPGHAACGRRRDNARRRIALREPRRILTPQSWRCVSGKVDEAVTIQLDHIIVPSRDGKAAAQLLASILGVPWAESGTGPFCPVYVNEGLTLDFDQAEGAFPVLHYCFRVSE